MKDWIKSAEWEFIKNFKEQSDIPKSSEELKISNLFDYVRLEGFEAIVTKLNDDRTWVRVNGREWLLDENNIIVTDSDRAADLPVDFDWREKKEECTKYIGNSKYPMDMRWMKNRIGWLELKQEDYDEYAITADKFYGFDRT